MTPTPDTSSATSSQRKQGLPTPRIDIARPAVPDPEPVDPTDPTAFPTAPAVPVADPRQLLTDRRYPRQVRAETFVAAMWPVAFDQARAELVGDVDAPYLDVHYAKLRNLNAYEQYNGEIHARRRRLAERQTAIRRGEQELLEVLRTS